MKDFDLLKYYNKNVYSNYSLLYTFVPDKPTLNIARNYTKY